MRCFSLVSSEIREVTRNMENDKMTCPLKRLVVSSSLTAQFKAKRNFYLFNYHGTITLYDSFNGMFTFEISVRFALANLYLLYDILYDSSMKRSYPLYRRVSSR